MELISFPIGFSLALPSLSPFFWSERVGNTRLYWLHVVKNWSKETYNNGYQDNMELLFVKNMRIALEICEIDMRLGYRYLEAL